MDEPPSDLFARAHRALGQFERAVDAYGLEYNYSSPGNRCYAVPSSQKSEAIKKEWGGMPLGQYRHWKREVERRVASQPASRPATWLVNLVEMSLVNQLVR